MATDDASRCTHRALALLKDAEALARAANEPPSARHLLVAATAGGGISQVVLESFGVTRAVALAAAANSPGRDEPLDAVLRRAAEELAPLGHRYVGTEHLLLALAAAEDGAAPVMLARLNLDAAALRREVFDILGHDLS